MKLVRTCAFILLLSISFIGIARLTHHATHGFRLSKITSNLCEEKQWASSVPSSNDLFKQRYYFLGRGLQSFVFASEDGRYVIKLFNNRYQGKITFYGILSHFPIIGHWAETRHSYFHSKLLRTFSSYQIAHEELHDAAGIVFSHLNKSTDLPEQLIIVDPLNIEHPINPNNYGFIIQKRAEMVYPTLLRYIEMGQIEEAKQAIASLIDLFVLKYQKGIADNDPLIRTNYGFIDGIPLQIDVGPFTKDPTVAQPEVYSQEILKSTANLHHWLEAHCPELCPFLEETLEKRI